MQSLLTTAVKTAQFSDYSTSGVSISAYKNPAFFCYFAVVM